MNTEDNKDTESIVNKDLQKATEKIPTFFLPLTKEQKKVESLFNNNMLKALALLGGEAFAPTTTVPGSKMEEIMEELFKEDVETLKEEVKENMRTLMKKKVEFDKIVEQETRKFQAAIIDKKKDLNQDFQQVMSKIKGIEELKSSYLKSLNVEQSDSEKTE